MKELPNWQFIPCLTPLLSPEYCIFAGVSRNVKYYLFLLLALGMLSGGQGFATVYKITHSAVLTKKDRSPNKELKLVQGNIQSNAVSTVQKNGHAGFNNILSCENNHPRHTSGFKSVYTLPLVKDYLFFIYPSHHFW